MTSPDRDPTDFESSRIRELIDAEHARGDGPKPMAAFALLYTTMAPHLPSPVISAWAMIWVESILMMAAKADQDRAFEDIMALMRALGDDLQDLRDYVVKRKEEGRDGEKRR